MITKRTDDKWLDLTTVRALLRLSLKGARNWVKRHCPQEGVRLEGRCLMVSLWAVNQGLRDCEWRPDLHQPRGFQGDSKRRPPNLFDRDSRGKFVSHRRDERPPRRKGFVHPTRRRYIKQTD